MSLGSNLIRLKARKLWGFEISQISNFAPTHQPMKVKVKWDHKDFNMVSLEIHWRCSAAPSIFNIQGMTAKLRPCLRFRACGWGCVRWKAPYRKGCGWYVKLTWLALLSLYYNNNNNNNLVWWHCHRVALYKMWYKLKSGCSVLSMLNQIDVFSSALQKCLNHNRNLHFVECVTVKVSPNQIIIIIISLLVSEIFGKKLRPLFFPKT